MQELMRLTDQEYQDHWTSLTSAMFNLMGVKIVTTYNGDETWIVYQAVKQNKVALTLNHCFAVGFLAGRKTKS